MIDQEGSRVSRIRADGGTKWVTPLEGEVGGVRPPHVVADVKRAYVTHKDGVTAC